MIWFYIQAFQIFYLYEFVKFQHIYSWKDTFNPFIPNPPFIYPLKTSENRKVLCFQEVEKGCIGNEWINKEPKG